MLSLFEMAYDTTARRLKAGDGSHKWSELPYLKPDIIDNLTSTSIEDALSANMGRYLKALHDGLRSDHEALKKLHNALRTEFNSLKAEYEKVKADHYALKDAHNALQDDHNTLKANHNALQRAHDSLQSSHDSLQSDHNKLKDLVNTKASQTDLTDHIKSTTPHPNWKPDLSFSDISGSLATSRLTGNYDASRVSGKLSNANIDTGNVNGLKAFVEGLIPAAETPNLSFSDISGTLDGSKITGSITTGKIPASNVTGNFEPSKINNLTSFIQNTSINATNINGLTQFVQNLIPDDSGGGSSGGSNGDGITDKSLSANGYIKFGNGFIVQWGTDTPSGSAARTVTFPKAFSSKCFGIICTPFVTENYISAGSDRIQANFVAKVHEISAGNHTSTTKFTYSLNFSDEVTYSGISGLGVYYIAIGT